MKMKSFMLACLSTLIGLSSCNNSENAPDINGEIDMYVKFDIQGTRAATDSVLHNSAVTLSDGALYFTTEGGDILHYIRITNTSVSGTLTAKQLTDGTVINQIQEKATRVHLYGNFEHKQSYTNISQINAIDLMSQTDAQHGVSNASLYGNGLIEDISGTHLGVSYNKRAIFNVKPIIARLEIEEVTALNTSDIKDFDLSGIYINNYYFKVLPNGQLAAGENVTNHLQAFEKYYRTDLNNYPFAADAAAPTFNPQYDKDWYEYLFDDGGLNGTTINGLGSSTNGSIRPSGSNNVWAYNVFAVANATPHIVFHFTNMEMKSATGNTGNLISNPVTKVDGEMFLTVTGYNDINNPKGFVDIEGGNIYRMKVNNFAETDLGPTPENKQKNDVLVQIKLLPWNVVEVAPNYD